MSLVSKKETEEFLETLFRNRLTEAERILQQLTEKYPEDSRYLHALRGIYLSYVGEDKDSLLHTIYTNEIHRKNIRKIAEHFKTLEGLLGLNDRFFQAWQTVLSLVDKLPEPQKIKPQQTSYT
ncbi:hypothetical protein CSUB_C1655 [Candidatus Caldarchaeum subterraneum]|uniref:Uncharacterized protein n=1 Tax=Caldiarchaeum subterraneum TaxID=311458 RepID=E6N9B6_CALS0|nr:hypothetical protein HGMM_F09F01C21 [Candidatus Caldarchaeum subterraneum]BAJ51506.1 hypothetical protein CSUB_C1655 [Candidatus Caldarchaeum subterraneum]